jgi:hypothetical protein
MLWAYWSLLINRNDIGGNSALYICWSHYLSHNNIFLYKGIFSSDIYNPHLSCSLNLLRRWQAL